MPDVDRMQLNDELTALLAGFGWRSRTDEDDLVLNNLTHEIADTAARVVALRPAFGKLLASDGWLPKEYTEPDLKSGMGSGIGQYALYRAEDRSLCLFSLVIPAGAETPIHDHLAWGPIGAMGQDNDEVLGGRLGLAADELAALREKKVIGESLR